MKMRNGCGQHTGVITYQLPWWPFKCVFKVSKIMHCCLCVFIHWINTPSFLLKEPRALPLLTYTRSKIAPGYLGDNCDIKFTCALSTGMLVLSLPGEGNSGHISAFLSQFWIRFLWYVLCTIALDERLKTTVGTKCSDLDPFSCLGFKTYHTRLLPSALTPCFQAQFNSLVFTYKALNGLGSGYLKNLLLPDKPPHKLRLSSDALFHVKGDAGSRSQKMGPTLDCGTLSQKRFDWSLHWWFVGGQNQSILFYGV